MNPMHQGAGRFRSVKWKDQTQKPGILNAYPDLVVEDVREALRYAAEAVRERELSVAGGS
jgi:hypothetical protein